MHELQDNYPGMLSTIKKLQNAIFKKDIVNMHEDFLELMTHCEDFGETGPPKVVLRTMSQIKELQETVSKDKPSFVSVKYWSRGNSKLIIEFFETFQKFYTKFEDYFPPQVPFKKFCSYWITNR